MLQLQIEIAGFSSTTTISPDVSGGPFGIEPSIRAAGNFYAILGFLIFPLIWSVPEAVVTAELGAAFQDPSAGVAWVEEAFGEKMAYLCGYLAWVSGATDNAIYPTLCESIRCICLYRIVSVTSSH